MAIVKARREKSFLRLGVAGPMKTGKSFSSLAIATGLLEFLEEKGELTGNGRICVIDTEHKSSLKYAKVDDDDDRENAFDFDLLSLEPPYSPEAYIKAIKEVKKGQYSLMIIDQITHEWRGSGGTLSLHSEETENSNSKNSWIAWRHITPRHDAFIEEFLAYPGHVICTMRAKVKHFQNKETKEIRKAGIKPLQREDTGYEFDIYGMMDRDHNLIIDESRCPELDRIKIIAPGRDVGRVMGEWLILGKGQTELRRGKLPQEKKRTISLLFKEVGYDDDDILECLTSKGVSEIDDLREADADKLIRDMTEYLESERRKAKREQQRLKTETETRKAQSEARKPIATKDFNGQPPPPGPSSSGAAATEDVKFSKEATFQPLSPEKLGEELENMMFSNNKESKEAPFEASKPNPLRTPPTKPVRKGPKGK